MHRLSLPDDGMRSRKGTMQAHINRSEPTEIVTTKQAADMLGVAVSTVQKWVEVGKLASWKTPGGHRRIPVAAIHAVLQGSIVALPLQGSMPYHDAGVTARNDSAIAAVTEVARVRATRATGLFDTPASNHYDRIVRVAALLTDMPIALISLLDEQRQWFKSRIGLSITETPRSWAFCNYTIMHNKIMMVEDASLDPRFSENPLVTGHEAIRFYAGVPLVDENACRLGTLCVLDRVPRKLTHDQMWALTELASMVSEEIQRSTTVAA
ncbi:MAG: excisionase family DNA-binding protein [Pseudomonadota bacterium]|nr:excisionase family DNA-binding protein [Pseudomonadota bacterium]